MLCICVFICIIYGVQQARMTYGQQSTINKRETKAKATQHKLQNKNNNVKQNNKKKKNSKEKAYFLWLNKKTIRFL